ncbi:MAG: hypothetical protein GF317_11035 [Candidatus Lokiarchaeota archaeon]|nr:hypothetical protein [Candidatus Lokiarchaeota archaeon]MBD3200197.1 hypothetical protein [Candidatus Lokiarchaeota archaeon]
MDVISYGVHDWIADSALRLLLKPPIWKEVASQIFPSDSNDPSESSIDLANAQEPSQHIIFRNDKYFLPYYSDKGKSIKGYSNEEWLKMRRYVNFLHGTYIPDLYHSYAKISVESIFIPEEQINIKVCNEPHHKVYFNIIRQDNDFFLSPYETNAIRAATNWAAAAIILSEKQTSVSYDNGLNYQNVSGKFEGMAQCLGAMTHLVADMGYPPHTTKKIKGAGCDLPYARFNKNTFSNGGPDWSIVNPLLHLFSIEPMEPAKAALSLAEITYSAIDCNGSILENQVGSKYIGGDQYEFIESMRPLAADFIPSTLNQIERDASNQFCELRKNRYKVLLGKSAYYTACALAYTLNKCNLNNTDTIGKRGTYKANKIIVADSIDQFVPSARPEDGDTVEDILKNQDSSSNSAMKTSSLVNLVRVGFIGLIGLSILEFMKKLSEIYLEKPLTS